MIKKLHLVLTVFFILAVVLASFTVKRYAVYSEYVKLVRLLKERDGMVGYEDVLTQCINFSKRNPDSKYADDLEYFYVDYMSSHYTPSDNGLQLWQRFYQKYLDEVMEPFTRKIIGYGDVNDSYKYCVLRAEFLNYALRGDRESAKNCSIKICSLLESEYPEERVLLEKYKK
ncbi:MAG: hypothetical protein MUC65_08185 [Pontiellaceae bacterium]|jgi:hypothetical protein|nr:hypothetical protein [Pontiellaceae bacterium]